MVQIIGAGLAGLSAAIRLAENNIPVQLVSVQPSERAQSVMAEGGINAALDTMGESDSVEEHIEDTLAGGVWLADPEAVRGLCTHAPEVVRWLYSLGAPFHQENGRIFLRNFGGQKKKRTAYAMSSTGKILMNTLIDAARQYEAAGLLRRLSHHEFVRLLIEQDRVVGARVRDTYQNELLDLSGPVILACGGMSGMFEGMTTGSSANTADVTAAVMRQGVRLANLEMMQYHPTTLPISGKRLLVTEAARGEGGRLFVMRGGMPWYFMEERYPVLKNLMPRDVVSREIFFVTQDAACGDQVYLDMRGVKEEVWSRKLADLREEVLHYTGLDLKCDPIPVEPGIHYFMGGIDVDVRHKTNLKNLYAAGECCCQYHGANRLGGNSLLGAIYGGRRAAETLQEEGAYLPQMQEIRKVSEADAFAGAIEPALNRRMRTILAQALGIVRCEEQLLSAQESLLALMEQCHNQREENRLFLAQAFVASALLRRESRGAHWRSDYQKTDAKVYKTVAGYRERGGVYADQV